MELKKIQGIASFSVSKTCYMFKNPTHVKKVGLTSELHFNFNLAFIDELWKTRKIRILRKWKKLLEISSFYTCTKNHNHMKYSSWDTEWDSHFELFFALLPPPLTTQKIKLLKNEKQSWRYYHFTHAYHKWKSYDVWFLRYGVWQTEFFLILEHFLHFYPSSPPPPPTPLLLP